ncbi:hypothetical protein [Paradevosia shaoguanensis]|uniref:PepSY domain-containing protein n=1 Tax=Paradevosia shaoguanensis TaxID=1335043 RepID=A0AA41UF18_9HYPH|nr:hypothetical protein [Paradevosia shaoguanensis]KFL27732.1 hypothetical protein JP74_06575 [Devosia sp. 17-2-E-8]MCF1741543.1 hypothetical protein [Paradevosia shaoguanensis]MCI0126026.1 hypothetical protein [Paradevosia shaoguanensis]QMV03104.1 hypothetical protein GHV40_17170 [Devosia sp. D6-9]
MYAKLALAFVAAAGLTGLAVPAQAAVRATAHTPDTFAACYEGSESKYIDDHSDVITSDLDKLGYNVSGVESLGSCVRAYITDSHGVAGMELFDPYTLKPITEKTTG